ncbi:FkbM family methyltransferase [Thiocapsa roseopersicina]|uniref:Methyltransferase, FkbM family n=1 Tax=Thiocapsa roseopersicina TaxID=1058 RepID=A0A1H2QBE3_THIRO|nr:FkbM family methyltransferase [Thiocapsa roseopersicina]SDW04481.1 methyltransferase, FkbM family [Thiocapsa roseopersicina]
MQGINFLIGQAINRFGYTLTPSWKLPLTHGNILAYAFRLLKARASKPVVIQIGAHDGVLDDPLRQLIAEPGSAECFLVEPQPTEAEKLRKLHEGNPDVHVLEFAVGRITGTADLYVPKGKSFLASLQADHHRRFGTANRILDVVRVAVVTPGDLFKKIGHSGVHVLQVDTEGLDWEIVSGVLDLGIRPSLINLEIMHLSNPDRMDMRSRLDHAGYDFIEYGRDCLALSRDFFLGEEVLIR